MRTAALTESKEYDPREGFWTGGDATCHAGNCFGTTLLCKWNGSGNTNRLNMSDGACKFSIKSSQSEADKGARVAAAAAAVAVTAGFNVPPGVSRVATGPSAAEEDNDGGANILSADEIEFGFNGCDGLNFDLDRAEAHATTVGVALAVDVDVDVEVEEVAAVVVTSGVFASEERLLPVMMTWVVVVVDKDVVVVVVVKTAAAAGDTGMATGYFNAPPTTVGVVRAGVFLGVKEGSPFGFKSNNTSPCCPVSNLRKIRPLLKSV